MSTDFFMDNACFACGADNKNGLQLNITGTNKGVHADIHLPVWTQGYKETVHGGIISTILDEMTVWAAYKQGHTCVTAELCVRWKKAMNTREDYTAHGRVVRVKHRLVHAESEIRDEHDNVIASAEAKLLRVA